MMAYPGFWRMAHRHWRVGIDEIHRSFSMAASVRALQALVPALEHGDVRRGRTGVRAQAVAPDGALVDDFRFLEADGMVHVLNAPSPAATASIAIGEAIAMRVWRVLEG
jgi:L-2-hydroxyglutarate oxidase